MVFIDQLSLAASAVTDDVYGGGCSPTATISNDGSNHSSSVVWHYLYSNRVVFNVAIKDVYAKVRELLVTFWLNLNADGDTTIVIAVECYGLEKAVIIAKATVTAAIITEVATLKQKQLLQLVFTANATLSTSTAAPQ